MKKLILFVLIALSINTKATTFQVTNTNATGLGSLAQAVANANADASATIVTPHLISFSSLPSGNNQIIVSGQLQVIRPVIIDGVTHTDGRVTVSANNGNIIILNFFNIGAISPAGSRVRNLNIINSVENGINIDGVTNVRIENCNIGVQGNGTTASSLNNGILLFGGTNNVQITNCLISGNRNNGIVVSGATTKNNIISGCKIGVSTTGNATLANGTNGIQLSDGTTLNTVTNSTISANNSNGLNISNASSNTISGNNIGVGQNGATALGNGANGITITTGSTLNTFTNNLISSNKSNGISIIQSTNNIFTSNKIGVTMTGLVAAGNTSNGVELLNASNNNKFFTNVISSNGIIGLRVATSTGTEIDGNFIGTGINGATSLGNASHGIQLFDAANASIIKNNVLSANGLQGLSIENSSNNTVQDNKIGVDINETIALGNKQNGIELKTATQNLIIGNRVSANAFNGFNITISSNNNTIENNVIGASSLADTMLRNTFNGIFNSSSNSNNYLKNTITSNGSNGMYIGNSNLNVVSGNKIGVGVNGVVALGNGDNGVHIDVSTNTTIGGNTVGSRNIISSNGLDGVTVSSSSNNKILGNFIGIDVTGSQVRTNGLSGINVYGKASFNNLIGDITFRGRNVISANSLHGVIFAVNAHNNEVFGNYIGTDSTGLLARGNGRNGISGESAHDNLIGGSSTNRRNIIAGNGFNEYRTDEGPYFSGISHQNSSGLTVKGNYIGLGSDGITVIPNANYGIWYDQSNDLTVGGSTEAERNVISGNGSVALNPQTNQILDPTGQSSRGIYAFNADTINIYGNYIGTNAAGTTAKPNLADGIAIIQSNNIKIGGATAGQGNLVSGNALSGIYLFENTTIQVIGNTLGLNANGTTSLSNGYDGLYLHNQNNATISGNTISGNNQVGIHLYESNSNSIHTNRVGLARTGTTKIGNVDGGIRILGAGNGTQNKIKFNTITGSTGANTSSSIGNGYGVFVGGASATGNLISENSISCNAGLEINLRLVTPNFGADAAGNTGKVAPVINPITTTSTVTNGTGTAGDTIEVYANPSNCGCGGEVYIGKTEVATNGTWSLTHAAIDSINVAALAIAANRNTSEFSCKKAVKGIIAAVTSTCLGDTTTLTATGFSASQLKWEVATNASFENVVYTAFADPNITPSTINFTAVTSGMFHARLISVVSSSEADTSATRTFVVTAPSPLGAISGTDSICDGASTTLTIANNLSTGAYIWYSSTDSTNWTPISGATTVAITSSPSQTTYYYADVDNNDCISPTTVKKVTVKPIVPVAVTLTVDTNDVCEGTTQTFTATAINAGKGATYQWKVNGNNTGTDSIYTTNNLTNGQVINVVITPDTSCPSSVTYTPALITAAFTPISKLSIDQSASSVCSGDSSLLTVTPDNAPAYKWYRLLSSGAYQEISNETSASLYVKPTVLTFYKVEPDGGKCITASDSVSVGVSSSVVGSVSVNQPASVCGTSAITFTATTNNVGATPLYRWFVKPVSATTYSLESQTSANTNSLNLANGDSLYVEVISSTACASAPSYESNRVGVTRNAIVTPTISLSSDVILCEQTDVTIRSTISGGVNSPVYRWFVNDELVANTADSLVLSNATDGDQVVLSIEPSEACTPDSVKSEPFIINLIPETVFNISINNYQKCLDATGVMSLTASTSIASADIDQYEWYVNGVEQNVDTSYFEFTPIVGDRVMVGASSSRNCLDEDTATSNQLLVQFSTPVRADGGGDRQVETLDEIQLTGILSDNATDFVWYQYRSNDTLFLDDSIIVNVAPLAEISVYELTASNEFCSDTDRVIVTYIREDVEIPNVFSPNNDDLHDKWVIKNSELFPDLTIQVFNRWGTLIFESLSGGYSSGSAWDGTYNGDPLPVATYYYIVDLKDGSEPEKGPVTILR